MNVSPPHVWLHPVGRMQEGQQRKERRSSLFVPLSALLFWRSITRNSYQWEDSEWWFPCPYSLHPSPHLPVSTLSHVPSGVPKGVEPCFPSQKAAAQALSSLWLGPGHMQREVGLCLWRVSCTPSGASSDFSWRVHMLHRAPLYRC